MPAATKTDSLSATFAALADPTRRAILARLAEGEATVGELAAPHAITAPSMSHHMKVLERAGLVVKGRDAQWRPCRIEVAPLAEADAWLAPYRSFFSTRLMRLARQLSRQKAQTPGTRATRTNPRNRKSP